MVLTSEFQFDILPENLLNRIQFVTTAMHAYGHQWACQLAYNPRLCRGLGLTDGEGVERTWSRLRKLVGVVRSSSVMSINDVPTLVLIFTLSLQRARRIWMTDRQLSYIAIELREDLGDWIRRRLKRGISEQKQKSEQVLSAIAISKGELHRQWELQKAAQMSVQSRTLFTL